MMSTAEVGSSGNRIARHFPLGDKPNNRPNEERWKKLLTNDKKMEIK